MLKRILLFAVYSLIAVTTCMDSLVGQEELPPHILCSIDSEGEDHVEFPIHPLLVPDPSDPNHNPDATWSTLTGYGGCPSFCNSGFDCCINVPCKKYRIPVVFTLLNDNNCGNNSITTTELNVFIDKINNYFGCLGVPFEFFRTQYWDDSDVNYRGNPTSILSDASTRVICNSDYNVFYLHSLSDGPPSDPNGNFFDDYQEVKVYNIPDVMNIYIPGNYNGFTGQNFISEGGIASFPTASIESYSLAFGIDGLNNTISDCTGNEFGSTVAMHEIGHWFGLTHTHGFVNNFQVNQFDPNGNFWAECPDGSDCCTAGDFICDTDADPNLGTGTVRDSDSNILSSCVVATDGCNLDASNCYSTCGAPYKKEPNTSVNLMSYAFCNRYDVTQCQMAKMVDGLLCARNNLVSCNPSFTDTDDAVPYVGFEEIHLCVGEQVPTFQITNPGGSGSAPSLDTDCVAWYLSGNNTLDFVPYGRGLIFDPSPYINTSFPGEYFIYFDDDLGKFTTTECDDQIRKRIKIKVSAEVQSAFINNSTSYEINSCTSIEEINLTSSVNQLANHGLIGWWITEDQPVSNTINSDSDLFNALSNSTINGTIGNPLNTIIPSTQGFPTTNLDLDIDCDKLDNNKTYFATPISSRNYSGIPDVSCDFSYTSITSTFLENAWPIQWINDPQTGFVDCEPNNFFNKCVEFTIELNITGYSGEPFEMLIDVREGGSFVPLFTYEEEGNGTYFLTEEDFPPCYDINELGVGIIIYERNVGEGAGTAVMTAQIEVRYPGEDPILFPDLTSFSDCIIGTPASFRCNCDNNISCPETNTTVNGISICSGQSFSPPALSLINPNGNVVTWSTNGNPSSGITIDDFDFRNTSCNTDNITFNPYILCNEDNDVSTAPTWVPINHSTTGSISFDVEIYPDPNNFEITIIESTGCNSPPTIIDSNCPTLLSQGFVTNTNTYRWNQQLPSFASNAPSGCNYPEQDGIRIVEECPQIAECPTINKALGSFKLCHNTVLDINPSQIGFQIVSDPGESSGDLYWTNTAQPPNSANSNVVNISNQAFTNTNCGTDEYVFYLWLECDIDGDGFMNSSDSPDSYMDAGIIKLVVFPDPELFRIQIAPSTGCDQIPIITDSPCPTIVSQGFDNSQSNENCQRTFSWDQELPVYLDSAPSECTYQEEDGMQVISSCQGCAGCPGISPASGEISVCHDQSIIVDLDKQGFAVINDENGSAGNVVWTLDSNNPNSNPGSLINIDSYVFENTNCDLERYFLNTWLECDRNSNGFNLSEGDIYLPAGMIELIVFPYPQLFEITVVDNNECGQAPTVIDSECPTLRYQGWQNQGPHPGCSTDDFSNNDPVTDTYVWGQTLPSFTNDPPKNCDYEENKDFITKTGCELCTDCALVQQGSSNEVICHGGSLSLDISSTGYFIVADPNNTTRDIEWTSDANPPNNDNRIDENYTFANKNCDIEEHEIFAWLQCDADGNGFSIPLGNDDSYVSAARITVQVYPNPLNYEIQVISSDNCGEPLTILDSYCPTLEYHGWRNQGPHPGCLNNASQSDNPRSDEYVWSQKLPNFILNAPVCNYIENDGSEVVLGCGEEDITGIGGSVTLCNSGPFTFVNFFTILSGNYQDDGVWTEGSGTLAGVDISYPLSVDFTNVPAGEYLYNYTVTTITGCVSISTITINVDNCGSSGLSNPPIAGNTLRSSNGQKPSEEVQHAQQSLSVFPNPFAEQTTLEFSISDTEKVHFRFFGVDGKLIYEIEDSYESGTHKLKIQSSTLKYSNLVYCEMKTRNHTEIKKLIILR